MAFEARKSSSVELCVAEWVSGSRFRDQTTIFAEQSSERPLLDVAIHRLEPAPRLASWHLARSIRAFAAKKGSKLIATQQHIPTAARIALFNHGIPVVLHTHNFIDPPVKGKGAALRNWLRLKELQSLGGITLVSDATLAQFERDWPDVRIPRTVLSNGFDFSTWNTGRPKENRIIVVGRVQEAKGILEVAQGVAQFLADARDWTATFILSEPQSNKPYFEQIQSALQPVTGQAEILTGIPFATVKDITETSAIAVVASKWIEPFGRTALEAHAAGIALISSGTGGLREISGDGAVFLPEISGTAIAESLRLLERDPASRAAMAERGAARVRRLFPLSSSSAGSDEAERIPSICERLDDFYDRVLAGSARPSTSC
ncbi:glycosyltransferase family 4 protein [Rhizobium sp. CG5]|uniref:glycosyltransferase family 4 protein n=1 Tax=Rhizobium sp. CG5 TaxID=2726076 RepID=UPI002033BB31|nr:glycosyltransferase family 4 protein [Rhizobium sp. CG5]MCM2476289.1 glycosyltransferase family 4 protein [Rhizobium sp. CG5]